MMKARRYLPGVPAELAYIVLHQLPYVDYEQAKKVYASFHKPGFHGTPAEAFLAANDRFYLLVTVLRRGDADNEWCYDRCREVEEAPDERLDLWARYHYKSTIITFAGSIQEVINDPELTVAIFGNTREVSQPFLEQIKRELEENELLKALFPDVFWQNPRQEAPTWSTGTGIVVKRKGNPKELTWQAFGIMEALPTGGHWKLRIYNDIVTYKSVTQTDSDQIGKTTTQWELSQNLGTHEGGRRWHEGTRYHFADAYGVMMDRRSLIPRIYPATHDGTLNGKPVFLAAAEWEKIKRDQRTVVAAQMLLNPLAGQNNTFFLDYLRPYEVRPRELSIYILGDPAGKPRSKAGDRTALAVIGVDVNSNRYLLDGYCHRMRMSERWTNLKNLFTKWKGAPYVQLVRVGYEKYGMQSDIEYFEEKIYTEKVEGLTIDEVAWVREGGQSKTARISRLEPYFRESQFWLPPKVWHPDFGGVCTWRVEKDMEPLIHDGEPVIDKKSNAQIMVEIAGSAKIVYTPYQGPSRAEAKAIAAGERYRVMQPIRRVDEDGSVYDLARMFFEEYRLHPFAVHDDLIDAISRIQDIEPNPPKVFERGELEGKEYADT